MYVMQSLPASQQGLASGIMNTLIRLSNTIALGIATAVYSSIEGSSEDLTQPMLKFTRTFQVSVALAAFGCLFVPFIRLGTQGSHQRDGGAQPDAGVESKEKQIGTGESNNEKGDMTDGTVAPKDNVV